jgi:hypothetical protein
MKLFRTLLTACALLAVLPAAASAQAGPGDNLSGALLLGSGPLPPSPAVIGINADTTNYTTENGEFNQCGQSAYGKTVWGIFTVNRTGRIDITAAGYDAVLGLAHVTGPGPRIEGGPCVDRLSGKIESFPRDNLPTVKKGEAYAIQIGGYQNPQDGQFAGGAVEVAVELLPPEQLIADAGLTWRSTRGGVRVTQIRVDGPQGSVAAIGCIRKKCGKDTTVRNPKLKGVFATPLAKADPSSTGKKIQPAKVSDAPVRMATKNVFRGRKVPNGGRIAVVVVSQTDDQIGQIFFWDVKNNAAGAKNIGCVEPGSGRVKKLGACNGA